MPEIMKNRATGLAEITHSEVKPFNQQTEGPTLSILELTEYLHGDIEGENQARSLLCLRSDGSGTLVGISRVVGKVGGKSGSFVLQASVIIANKHAEGKYFVLPESGTEGLRGLRGEGGFDTEQGHPSKIWLDYWYE